MQDNHGLQVCETILKYNSIFDWQIPRDSGGGVSQPRNSKGRQDPRHGLWSRERGLHCKISLFECLNAKL